MSEKELIRVLLVSKPLAPPWNDSSKNLAKDIAVHAKGIQFNIMTTRTYSFPFSHIQSEPVYQTTGTYAPGLKQNAKVFMRMLQADPEISVYHFFFAPNPLTSTVLKWALKFKRKKILHTICSEPKSYKGIKKLVFADKVVALSEDTRDKLRAQGVENVVCIRPGIEMGSSVKGSTNNPYQSYKSDGKLNILFSGDYEYSGAHQVIVSSLEEIFNTLSNARIIFACRPKTRRAFEIERELLNTIRQMGFEEKVVFLNEVPNMLDLIEIADFAVFPAISLYHKMDMPLVLLECLAREVPLVVSHLPSLEILGTEGAALLISPHQRREFAQAVIRLGQDSALRKTMGEKGRRLVESEFNIQKISEQYEALYRELGTRVNAS